ncbi:MAG: 50S ribosomal protein L30 [Acidimicrobiales bacterium]
MAHAAQIVVRQVRSAIGTKPKHRGTLRALGLRGIGQTNTLPDRPEIRGMIARVPHLVTVEPATATEPTATEPTAAEPTATEPTAAEPAPATEESA